MKSVIAGEIELGFRREDVDQRQLVALAHFEIVEVMRGRDFHRTSAFFRISIVVANNRDAPADERQDCVTANQVFETLIIRMHRHGGVPQHRFRPGRGDNYMFVCNTLYRILQVPQMTFFFDLLDFEIRNPGEQLGVPVDQPLVLVDQPGAVELDKDLDHRA